jgi:hypothetical protein
MMPNMMPGMGTYMFFWLALATLVCLLLIGTCIWLVAGWLKKQRTPLMQDTPQPRDAYEGYEQVYQPQQQPPETYQEGGQPYSYPQNEQPQAQYQEMEQLQH